MDLGKWFGRPPNGNGRGTPEVALPPKPSTGYARVARNNRPAPRKLVVPGDRFTLDELVPMLRSGAGICAVCSQPSDRYELCLSCRSCVEDLDDIRTHVLPVALAVKGGTLAYALWKYKSAANLPERQAATHKLGDLTQRYLERHEGCLAKSVGTAAFDVITWVPSSQGRAGRHPLADMLDSLPWSRGRMVEGLHTNQASHGETHHADRTRFVSDSVFRGQHVLIVDDTWTRGANALSAASLVRTRGAKSVAIAVIGRHFNPEYRDSARYSDHATALGFDFDACIYCDNRPNSQFAETQSAAAVKRTEFANRPQPEESRLSAYDQEVADMVGFAKTYGSNSFELLEKLRDSEFDRYRKALASIRAGQGQAVAGALDEWWDAQ